MLVAAAIGATIGTAIGFTAAVAIFLFVEWDDGDFIKDLRRDR
jgi:hypothetical protein